LNEFRVSLAIQEPRHEAWALGDREVDGRGQKHALRTLSIAPQCQIHLRQPLEV
jgi:hypothetical protein